MTESDADSVPPRSMTESQMTLSLHPSIPLISCTRRYAGELLSAVIRDEDAASRVAMTIHELLENTLKYSTDGLARLHVLVEEAGIGERRVEVRASNRTTPELAAELSRRIDSLAAAEDPFAFYIAMMRESAEREGSGLGLARIRVEGEMRLTYSLDGDCLTVSASTQGDF